MNGLIVNILKQYEEICLCGDGRNDLPGHCARYCVYTLMEHATKVVVDMAVVHKRETGGNSVTMEKEGLRRLLEKMATILPFSEITPDASSSIMKLVCEKVHWILLYVTNINSVGRSTCWQMITLALLPNSLLEPNEFVT